jgi:uncharacterized protein YegJ (DUF2314 family)
MDKNNICHIENGDPRMLEASKNARDTFKYFLRELSWENRRIIPGLELACIKVSFDNTDDNEGPTHEVMWINDLNFDGKTISGILVNKPQWIDSLSQGDEIKITLDQIVDWMYAVNGKAYGAFTVNVIRSNMGIKERKAHDKAWGLDFGNPAMTEIIYQPQSNKKLLSFFSKPQIFSQEALMEQEHPMSINMLSKYREQLSESGESTLAFEDEAGNTLLHIDAMSGNSAIVKLFLEFGADITKKNVHGQTPLDLAKLFKWDKIIKQIEKLG